mgnify:FL=1
MEDSVPAEKEDATKEKIPFPHELADAGSYEDGDAFNCDTDKYDNRKDKDEGTHCQNVASPLASKKTVELSAGWRWCGCDHKEPYSTFMATCRKCRKRYRFTVYTMQ